MSSLISPLLPVMSTVSLISGTAMLASLHHQPLLLNYRAVGPTVSSSLCPHYHHNSQKPHYVETQDPTLRRHNSRSTSLFVHQLSHTQKPGPSQTELQENRGCSEPIAYDAAKLSPEEKSKLIELSLLAKRTRQFPGSIYAQSPSDADVASPLPPLPALLGTDTEDEEDEREMIQRALEIRRRVTRELFKEAMIKKGRFGITYSANVAGQIIDFIDHVMIKAAALKRLPEFSDTTFNLRAKTVIHDSNVVPLIRWLKHNGLSYNKIGKLICMSRGNLDSIKQTAEWLKSVHVKGEFLGVAFLRSGGNILQRSEDELNEIVDYLEMNGARRDWMGYVLSRCPELLSFSIEEVKTRVEFYLNMGMSKNDFGTMVFDCPKVLGYFSLEEMSQKVDYLKEFGLNTADVGRLLAFKPQLMVCSIEERWKPLVKYLYYLGISKDGMRRMLTLKPMVFCVDLETTIAPKVRFFQDLGIPDNAIGNMLAKFPHLLTYSLYKKIRPVVIFLITKAGVDAKDVGKVIALAPELLGCSIGKKLDINLRYFLSLGIRLRQLGAMITDFPMLLRYNVDVLRPKYRYLRRTMVRPLEDLIEFPRFFSYSLEGRIIPRYTAMVEDRVNFKLRYMLACTDEEFEWRVKDKVERRRKFEAGIFNDDLVSSSLKTDEAAEEADSDNNETDCALLDTRISDNSPELVLSD